MEKFLIVKGNQYTTLAADDIYEAYRFCYTQGAVAYYEQAVSQGELRHHDAEEDYKTEVEQIAFITCEDTLKDYEVGYLNLSDRVKVVPTQNETCVKGLFL